MIVCWPPGRRLHVAIDKCMKGHPCMPDGKIPGPHGLPDVHVGSTHEFFFLGGFGGFLPVHGVKKPNKKK